LPQLEVMTMFSIKRSAKIYSRIRLWGSIGFIVIAIISGEIVGRFSAEVFTAIGWLILLALTASSFLLKQPKLKKEKSVNNISIVTRIIEKNFVLFFFAGLLLQASFGPYYSFFALFLRDYGYPDYAVGLYISLGVIAEIGIFFIAGMLFKAFSIRALISFSLLLTAFRWFVTGHFVDSALILIFVQLIHAASFGLYHGASIQFLQSHFQQNQQNRGQAIYVAGVYGVGGALGAYVSGVVWQDGVGALTAFEYAGWACLIAALFSIFLKMKK